MTIEMIMAGILRSCTNKGEQISGLGFSQNGGVNQAHTEPTPL
jgi:hypothetical protein